MPSLAAPESAGKLIALGIVLPALSTFFVLCRFWARRLRHTVLGPDDFLIVPAMVLVWGLGITQIIGCTIGDLGDRIGETPNGAPIIDHRTQEMSKNEFAFQLIEKIAFGLIKLSILFFYRRVFIGRIFNIASWTMVVIVSVWSFSFFMSTVLECRPLSIVWSPNRGLLFAKCINTVQMLLAFAWSDVFTDVLILSMPIPMVWGLQMPLRRKVALCGIFLLGGLTVLAGVARLVFFYRAAKDHMGPDIAVNTAPTIYWSLIEACMAVVSACLPPMRPIFRGMSPESILGSIRDRISLQSMRGSNGSKGSKGSKVSKGSKTSRASRRGFSNIEGGTKAPETNSTSSLGLHGGTSAETELEISSMPRAHLTANVPNDRIVITKSFDQADDNV